MDEGNINIIKVLTISETIELCEVCDIISAAACQCLKKKCVSPRGNLYDDRSV